MKKLSVICMMFLSVVFFATCTKVGPMGPQGPQGPQGPALNQYGQWVVTIDYPAINNNVYNYGAVLVYMDVDGAWSQVPLTYYYQDLNDAGELINCEASIEVATLNDGGVRLFWTESDFYGGMRPQTCDFKIVAIEATVYSHRSDVDYSNYEAVKAAYQLAD